MMLCFQALKEKEEEMVESALTENPSEDHCEGAVDAKSQGLLVRI
jgi:hypothetical protein